MIKRNVTLKDIAAVLGVTPMTVSKALNDHPDISAARKREIIEMAKQMNYVPNAIAKNLRTNSSKLIGVIVADNSNPYFANTLKGIEQEFSSNNYHTVIFNSNENPEKERMFIDDLRSLSVAGILISPALGNKENVSILQNIHIPFVLFSRYINRNTDAYVIADDVNAGFLATEHLLSTRGEKIFFINSNMEVSTARDRLEGYKTAYKKRGLPINEQNIFFDAIDISDGYSITKKILGRQKPPFSLLCYSDYIAIGALQALYEEKLKIPQDVALMGIDNIEYSAFTSPKLSTISLPSVQIGTASARLLLKLIKNKKAMDNSSKQIILTPHLLIRDST